MKQSLVFRISFSTRVEFATLETFPVLEFGVDKERND